MNELKLPPQSIEAEQALLAAILERNSLIDELEEVLSEQYFYRHEHQVIYKRMSAMALRGQPIDPAVLIGYLESAGELDDAGGTEYLVDLATSGRGTHNSKHYAQIIHDRWTLRQLIAKGQRITEIGFDFENAAEAVQEAQAQIMDFEQVSGETQNLTEQLKSLVNKIEFLQNNKGKITGVQTGYIDLDKRLSGLQKSNLIILAGRPGQGKTTAAMNMAEFAAIAGKNVLVFSLEMASDELLMRSACSIGRIDHEKLLAGEIDDAWPNVNAFMVKIRNASLTIDDRPSLTSEQIFSRARKVVRVTGRPLDLIVLDHIGLLSDKGDELQKITNITRNLKLLAKSMNCPVLALSQLNRECEKRPNKRPLLSDLRSSGSIEQDADIIAFVYRDEYYNPDSEQKGIAEINIAKFRAGRTGVVYMASNLAQCRFDNLAGYVPPQRVITKKRGGFDYE